MIYKDLTGELRHVLKKFILYCWVLNRVTSQCTLNITYILIVTLANYKLLDSNTDLSNPY